MANFNNIPERGKGFKYVNSPPLVTAPHRRAAGRARRPGRGAGRGAGRPRRARRRGGGRPGRVGGVARGGGTGRLEPPRRAAGLSRLRRHHRRHPDDRRRAGGAGRRAAAVLSPASSALPPTSTDSGSSNAGNSPDVGYDDAFSLAAWMYPTAESGVIVSRAAGGDQGEVGWGLYLRGRPAAPEPVDARARRRGGGGDGRGDCARPVAARRRHLRRIEDPRRHPHLRSTAACRRSSRCSTSSATGCRPPAIRCASGPAGRTSRGSGATSTKSASTKGC